MQRAAGRALERGARLPEAFDFDSRHIAIPTPMFANDVHGDCVIAGRAHQTLRFEYLAQHEILPITDRHVLSEWRKENARSEDGLSVLDSLKERRKRGWKIGKSTYKIQAFAEIDRTNPDEIRKAIVMHVGVGLGFNLPYNALPLFQGGQPWDVTKGPGARVDPDGGHYVYCRGYTKLGPVCVTWGRKQQMTWRFVRRYCDEAYAVVDARDEQLKRSTTLGGKLDYRRLGEQLELATS